MTLSDELSYPGGDVRLFVDAALGESARVALHEGQAHYLLHVMRAKPGDRVRLFNGRDGEWLARVAETRKRACVLECMARVGEQRAVPDLWLVFAPIKKTPADYVAQKAAELGVSVLQPVLTHRTIARRVNLERLRANAVEASEQSGRVDVPDIREPRDLDKLVSDWPRERRILFCDEGGDVPPVATALRDAPTGPWAILTGPEGGFDAGERALLRAQSFVVPVGLGSRILRADTAALAALSVWQALAGDWRA
ncbi:MAG TPA: 16S rRNA (uracil(1498)-N(3))-methyltransferase [Rhizomicrobium sp.]|nr:16S rRNA (uracil(1498)-N(3))-methyltransferase [Rhizomicrobium sp.]